MKNTTFFLFRVNYIATNVKKKSMTLIEDFRGELLLVTVM